MRAAFVKEYLKPFLVLVCICAVVAALLAFTNSKTEPVIEANNAAEAAAVREKLLPDAVAFEELEVGEDSGIDSVFYDTGGSGYVITASREGYGGTVTVAVAVDNDGVIVGIDANVSTETTGVGSKAGEESYLQSYLGLSDNADSVDTISGATFSSSAVKNCVSAALAAFNDIKEAE